MPYATIAQHADVQTSIAAVKLHGLGGGACAARHSNFATGSWTMIWGKCPQIVLVTGILNMCEHDKDVV